MIADRCTEVETGARNVDHILTRTLLPEMSAAFLARMAEGQAIGQVHVSVDEQGGFSLPNRINPRNSPVNPTTTCVSDNETRPLRRGEAFLSHRLFFTKPISRRGD